MKCDYCGVDGTKEQLEEVERIQVIDNKADVVKASICETCKPVFIQIEYYDEYEM